MKDIRQLTDEEKSLIVYFYEEKGEIPRWSEWGAMQPIIERWHPELLKALHDVQVAKKVLDAVVRSL